MKAFKTVMIIIGIILALILSSILIIAIFINGSFKKQTSENIAMTTEQLLKLPADKLNIAVLDRIEARYDMLYKESTDISKMKPIDKTIYTVFMFDMEVCNGGLCQYFVNSSRITAPYLSEALVQLSADEYNMIFTDFIDENNIDLFNLEQFICEGDNPNEYIEKTKLYNFDSFDDKFQVAYEKQNLSEALASYIRAHVEEI